MSNNIIPGILEKDWIEIERKIGLIMPFSKIIHIDIIDGKFAQNLTFLDPAPFAKYTKDIFFELHMMVEEPIQYLKPWADAGFKRFIGHVEKMSDQIEFVAEGQLLGEVGLAIDEQTGVDSIEVPFSDFDVLLLMTVKTGRSGQIFKRECLEKIKILLREINTPLEVDGGINDKTIAEAKSFGATRFVSTSFIFDEGAPLEQYKKLQEEISVDQTY